MGPPNGDPFAVVSASDLSRNGLFIDADRPVKVGARFSAEISLGDDVLYIPEAEVAYNRERSTGSGFGARFVDPPGDVIARIEEEIMRAHAPMSAIVEAAIEEAIAAPVTKPDDNFDPDGATEIPAKKKRTIEVDVSQFHEPVLSMSSLPPIEEDPIETDSVEKEASKLVVLKEAIMRAGRQAQVRFVERARRYPPLWTGVAMIGLCSVLSAVGLALWMGSSAEAVEIVKKDARGITAPTQLALMGEQKLPEIVEAPPAPKSTEAASEPKKPLPPLVVVDESSPTVVKKVEEEPKPTDKKADAKPAKPAKAEAKPANAGDHLDASLAKVAASAKPAPAGKKVAGRAKLKLGVASSARVLKTHVLKAPDRFVIDLAGQPDQPSLPGTGGAVKAVRVGKHPDHTRVVIETASRIEQGLVTKKGRELSVTLDLLR